MHILADTYICIACRLGSKRLHKKALRKIGGTSLIDILLTRLSSDINPKQIILCTTDEPESYCLKERADKYGVRFYQGDQLDVMNRFIQAASIYQNCNHIVRVTADNPMTDIKTMLDMVHSHKIMNAEYTYTKSIPRGLRSEIINYDYLKDLHSRIIDPSNTEYMTYYLMCDKSKKNMYMPSIQVENLTFTVDTEEQLEFLKSMINKSENGIGSTYDQLVSLVKRDFGIAYSNIETNTNIDFDNFQLKLRQ